MADLDHIYGREAIEDARRALDAPVRISGATVMDFARVAQRGRLEQVQKPTTQEKVVFQNNEVAQAVDVDKASNHDQQLKVYKPFVGKIGYGMCADHFRVTVDGSPLPSSHDLRTKYFDDVSPLFSGGRPWVYHTSCRGLIPGECDFFVKRFVSVHRSDDVIVWGDENGYRPATHIEAVVFARALQILQWKHYIIALGSTTGINGSLYVAVLNSLFGKRVLGDTRYQNFWRPWYEFLFVRK